MGAATIRAAKTLLIDDSTFALKVMELTLNELGIADITTAENGLLGFETFTAALQSRSSFTLVFLDIEMPVMNGQKSLKLMRAAEDEAGVLTVDKATIIMATTLHSPADMMDALIDGDCSDYYVKTSISEDIGALLVKYCFIPTQQACFESSTSLTLQTKLFRPKGF
jgi:two-component system chemotaxis response regulator CheY